jgi:hypothetical protein
MHIILGNSNLLISVLLLLPALYPNFPVAKRLQSTGPIIAPRVESGEEDRRRILRSRFGADRIAQVGEKALPMCKLTALGSKLLLAYGFWTPVIWHGHGPAQRQILIECRQRLHNGHYETERIATTTSIAPKKAARVASVSDDHEKRRARKVFENVLFRLAALHLGFNSCASNSSPSCRPSALQVRASLTLNHLRLLHRLHRQNIARTKKPQRPPHRLSQLHRRLPLSRLLLRPKRSELAKKRKLRPL